MPAVLALAGAVSICARVCSFLSRSRIFWLPLATPNITVRQTDVVLPNITCRKCTLQVVEFVAKHGANNPRNYAYHHCADPQITADPANPIDKQWPAERASGEPPSK